MAYLRNYIYIYMIMHVNGLFQNKYIHLIMHVNGLFQNIYIYLIMHVVITLMLQPLNIGLKLN